jgi:hypothetical protein
MVATFFLKAFFELLIMRGTMSTPMKCEECGKKILIPNYRKDTFRFCSRSCGFHWHSKHDRVPKICKTCKKSFTVIRVREKIAKYCSPNCYYAAMKDRGSVLFTCRHCGKTFRDSPSVKRIYCSRACVNKSDLMTWSPKKTTLRKQMQRRGMILKCQRCKFDKIPQILGIHHKDRNPENNAKENLEVLCPNCHSIEHLKHIAH